MKHITKSSNHRTFPVLRRDRLPEVLDKLPETVNKVFDLLELLVVRLLLLALVALGAYELFKGHQSVDRSPADVEEGVGKYEGCVSLGFRDYPLLQIHPQAQQAAEASRCAGEQGKFREHHDLLFANPSLLQQTGMIEHARKLQLDDKRFEACLASGKFRIAVQSDLQDGTRAGVNGTPAFWKPETAQLRGFKTCKLLPFQLKRLKKPRIFSGFRPPVDELGLAAPETPSVWLHCGTPGRRNGLRGLEFDAEAKDSGAVTIISISCDYIP